MKHIPHVTIVTLTLLLSVSVFSQGFYVKVHGGYNWPGFQNNAVVMAPRVDAAHTSSDGLVAMANIDDSAHSYKQVYGSYAAGANISLGVGYMVTHWFGVEMTAHYLWGAKATSTVKSNLGAVSPAFEGMYLNADIRTYAKNGITLTPMLVFVAAKKEWKVQPHAKLGLVLPVGGRVIHELDIASPLSLPVDPYFVGTRTSVVLSTESTFSIGAIGSVGVRYTPIPLITVFADMNAQWLNIRAKKTTITRWDVYDGGLDKNYDMLHPDPADPNAPVRPTYRTEFVYVDQLDANSNNADHNPNYDPNKPKEDARITAPAGNVGFQIGIQFNLGKQALAGTKKK